MGSPHIAIIVLNYRGEKILPACLASLSRVIDPGDSVIVVDNGKETELLQSLMKQHPYLEVLTPEKNLGFAAGMNMGLRHALRGQYDAFWLMNNDAAVEKGALLTMKQALIERGGKYLFSPLIRKYEGSVWFSGGTISFFRMRSEHRTDVPTDQIYETNFLTGCALFIPREAIEVIGLLDERYFLYYEDAEYSSRAKQKNIALLMVPGAIVLHQEVSRENPEKTYWLVRSGSEFFLRESPFLWRIWVRLYFFLRRVKNAIECKYSPSPIARSVQKAYTDASPYV